MIGELGEDCVKDGSLREKVRQVRDGLFELGMRAETNYSAIKSLSHETKDELETVDVKLSKIHSLLGKRGQEDGTLSAFSLLTNLEEQLKTLKALVRPAVDLASGAKAQAAKQKREIFTTLQTGCNPLFQLFHKLSSDESSKTKIKN
jgi:hypothetical protein